MELIVFNFIIHILSLLATIIFSAYVYYYATIRYLHEFLAYLFLVTNLINVINLLPLLIRDIIWIKWKIIKRIEKRNAKIAEEFLSKFQDKKNERKVSTIFSDIVNHETTPFYKHEELAELEEVSDEEYNKYQEEQNKIKHHV